MSRGGWFTVGLFVGAFLEEVGQEIKKREVLAKRDAAERKIEEAILKRHSDMAGRNDRLYEQAFAEGERMGRLNQQMGAP